MTHSNKILLQILLLLTLMMMAGCNQEKIINNSLENSTTIKEGDSAENESPNTPLQWINYKGEKYEFRKIFSEEEIDKEQLIKTDSITDSGDGFLQGQVIYIYKIDGSIFAIDDSGPTKEWVNFIKK